MLPKPFSRELRRSGGTLGRLLRSERGISLTEVMTAMALSALIGILMITWFSNATRVDQTHLADDTAMQELREVREQFTKDLRRAQELTIAESHRVTAWVDLDRDGELDAAELIAWEIDTGGDLTRTEGGGTGLVRASGVSYGESGFSYDASVMAEVTRVGLDLVVEFDQPGSGRARGVDTEVALRNAGGE